MPDQNMAERDRMINYAAEGKPAGGSGKPEAELADLEGRRLSFERVNKGLIETVENTTFPWVVRREVRLAMLDRFTGPAGYFDNYSDLHAYELMVARSRSIKNSTADSEVRKALGLQDEPWRDEGPILRQNKEELKFAFLKKHLDIIKNRDGRGENLDSTEGEVKEANKLANEDLGRSNGAAERRLPEMGKELESSANEFALSKKLTNLYFSWISMATGQQVGQLYSETPIWFMPKATDFAEVLDLPSNFMTRTHDNRELKAGDQELPGYPTPEQIQKLLEHDGLARENEPLGEMVERGVKIKYLSAISECPEKVMQWKFTIEQKTLNSILLKKGFDPEYPAQKAAGILALTDDEKRQVSESWWKDLGFASEQQGREYAGFPEMWIPFEARRGTEIAKDAYGTEETRQTRLNKIAEQMALLRQAYARLSPLSNPNSGERNDINGEIKKITNKLREWATTEKGENLLSSLLVEREIGGYIDNRFIPLRGKKDISLVWYGDLPARPQIASEKEAAQANFLKYLGNDKLANSISEVVYTLWGFKSKYGFWARDFNSGEKDTSKAWRVDVEAWPYSDEMAVLMAFKWWQIYKREAAGPEGSRGKFGPLMTDYLTYSQILPETTTIVKTIEENGQLKKVAVEIPLRDSSGRELLKIIDERGQIRPGRPDEGLVIGDYQVSLLQLFESGADMSDKKLWGEGLEDPYRRFLLRGFFGEGRTWDGSDIKTILTKTDWKDDELLGDKFWESFKLAVKVGIRKEQYDEPGWVEIFDLPQYQENGVSENEDFRQKVDLLISKLTDPSVSLEEKSKLKKDHASLYSNHQDERKRIIEDYIYKTWWKGILSLSRANEWKQKTIKVLNSRGSVDDTSILKAITLIAKSHKINLPYETKTLDDDGKDFDWRVKAFPGK